VSFASKYDNSKHCTCLNKFISLLKVVKLFFEAPCIAIIYTNWKPHINIQFGEDTAHYNPYVCGSGSYDRESELQKGVKMEITFV
jgi:hypothetical protein